MREAVVGRFPEDDASDAQGMASNGHQTQLELDLEVNSQYEVCLTQDLQTRNVMFGDDVLFVQCSHPL